MLSTNNLLLFLLFLALILAVLSQLEAGNEEEEVQQLIDAFNSNEEFGFLVMETIDEEKLKYLSATDYEKIKKELNIDGDFSIYFQDENGRIVAVTNKYCLGSNNSFIANVRCI